MKMQIEVFNSDGNLSRLQSEVNKFIAPMDPANIVSITPNSCVHGQYGLFSSITIVYLKEDK